MSVESRSTDKYAAYRFAILLRAMLPVSEQFSSTSVLNEMASSSAMTKIVTIHRGVPFNETVHRLVGLSMKKECK